MMRLKDWPKRLRLLARDYCNELPAMWSIAITRDCERWGGHYWGPAQHDKVLGFGRTCSGCGTFEYVSQPDRLYPAGTGPYDF